MRADAASSATQSARANGPGSSASDSGVSRFANASYPADAPGDDPDASAPSAAYTAATGSRASSAAAASARSASAAAPNERHSTKESNVSSAAERESARAPSGGVMASRVMVTRATRLSTALSPNARASRTSSCAIEAASRANAGVRAFPHSSRSAHAWLSKPSVARGFFPGETKSSARKLPARRHASCASASSPAYPASSIASTHRFATSSRVRCSRCFVTRSSGSGARSDSRNASNCSSSNGSRRAAAAASAETSIARDAARSVAGAARRTTSRRKRWLVTGHRGRTEDASSFSSFSKSCVSMTQNRRRTVAAARAAIGAHPSRDATTANRLHAHVLDTACAASTGSVAAPTPLITTPDASNATTANA